MRSCSSCGGEIPDDMPICPSCGHHDSCVTDEDAEPSASRREEYAGSVIKCPSCGEQLSGFVAVCPSCGHEINSNKVASSFQAFVDAISWCDYNIANASKGATSGWSSWSGGIKFWWIVLNVLTLCIPLLIYMALPLVGISWGKLSPEEMTKKATIENAAFDNDKETIIEVLLFIKGKMTSLEGEKTTRDSLRWAAIWRSKADQVFQKAKLLFKDDTIIQDAHSGILAIETKIRKYYLIRVIAVAVIALLLFVLGSVRGCIADKPASDSSQTEKTKSSVSQIDQNATYEWPATGLSSLLPIPEKKTGVVNLDTNETLTVTIYQANKSDYETYKEACRSKGFNVDSIEEYSGYKSYDNEGNYLFLHFIDFDSTLTVKLEKAKEMSEIQWPKSDLVKEIPVPSSNWGDVYSERDTLYIVYIGKTSYEDYQKYVSECMDKGFTEGYFKDDNCFSGDNSSGHHLRVEYLGYETMEISIDD